MPIALQGAPSLSTAMTPPLPHGLSPKTACGFRSGCC